MKADNSGRDSTESNAVAGSYVILLTSRCSRLRQSPLHSLQFDERFYHVFNIFIYVLTLF